MGCLGTQSCYHVCQGDLATSAVSKASPLVRHVNQLVIRYRKKKKKWKCNWKDANLAFSASTYSSMAWWLFWVLSTSVIVTSAFWSWLSLRLVVFFTLRTFRSVVVYTTLSTSAILARLQSRNVQQQINVQTTNSFFFFLFIAGQFKVWKLKSIR